MVIFWSGVPSYRVIPTEPSLRNLADGILIKPMTPWLLNELYLKLSEQIFKEKMDKDKITILIPLK